MNFVADEANKIMTSRWIDNSIVTIASTNHLSYSVKRFSQKGNARLKSLV